MLNPGRRRLVFAGALVSATSSLFAQSTKRLPLVAFLGGGKESDSSLFVSAFLSELRALGYRDGENIRIETRYAEYSAQRATALARELAARKPSVIVANGGGIDPAYREAPEIPLVLIHSGDPVIAGFAESFAKPGRHATGISLLALDLIPKRIEFLGQIVPKMRRIAFLASPEHAGQKRELTAFRAAADRIGATTQYFEARTPAELASALPAVAAARPDAALLFSDALMVGQRQKLADFFVEHRIPSAAGWSAFPESGHLLSYGPERLATWRRLAHFVDKIIKGARPSELPIELPTAFELVVNRRTAAAMGLALQQAILVQADRVID